MISKGRLSDSNGGESASRPAVTRIPPMKGSPIWSHPARVALTSRSSGRMFHSASAIPTGTRNPITIVAGCDA
jgi:hypothetical protein